MKKQNIEVEGGEILLMSDEGHYAVIPAKHRQEVIDMVKEGCDNCINAYIQTLPKDSDYAEDGSLIPDDKIKGTASIGLPKIKTTITGKQPSLYKPTIATDPNAKYEYDPEVRKQQLDIIKNKYIEYPSSTLENIVNMDESLVKNMSNIKTNAGFRNNNKISISDDKKYISVYDKNIGGNDYYDRISKDDILDYIAETNNIKNINFPGYSDRLENNKKYNRSRLNITYNTLKSKLNDDYVSDDKVNTIDAISDDDLIKNINDLYDKDSYLTNTKKIFDNKERPIDIDYSDILNYTNKHHKSNYGKNTNDIKYVKSKNPRYNDTPIHNKLKEDIFKAADKIGIDRYEALALAMVESNVGMSYQGQANRKSQSQIFSSWDATGYDDPLMKHKDVNISLSDFAIRKGVKLPIQKQYQKEKGNNNNVLNFSELSTKELKELTDEYNKYISNIKLPVSNYFEGALKYYKEVGKNYNSGDPQYLNKVNSIKQELKNQNY